MSLAETQLHLIHLSRTLYGMAWADSAKRKCSDHPLAAGIPQLRAFCCKSWPYTLEPHRRQLICHNQPLCKGYNTWERRETGKGQNYKFLSVPLNDQWMIQGLGAFGTGCPNNKPPPKKSRKVGLHCLILNTGHVPELVSASCSAVCWELPLLPLVSPLEPLCK